MRLINTVEQIEILIKLLVQSISVFSLAVFLWALLPEINWMMIVTNLVKIGTP